MNRLLLPLIIYLISITYIVISGKILYLCTLKYYSLLRYIINNRRSMMILNNKFIKYRRTVRYLRIHVAASSIVATVNIFMKTGLIMDLIITTMPVIGIITTIDALTLKARFASIEDKLYRIHNNIQEDNF